MNLLNRELFEFPSVHAFPNDSRIGLDERTFSVIFIFMAVELHKKSTMHLVDSVFPESVIPAINMDCDLFSIFSERKAEFAVKRSKEIHSNILKRNSR